MMATSAAPARNASAHCDGTVNDNSYFPRSGPFVKPHTKGAVFRYCTIDMRSLAKRMFSQKPQYSRREFAPRKHAFVVKLSRRFAAADFGGVKNVETFALADVSAVLACKDIETDPQFVLHFDGAAADLDRCDAVIGLQDRNLTLAAQQSVFRAHAQGKAHGLLDAVQLQLAGYGQLPSFRVLFRAGNSRRSKGDLGKLGDVQDFLAFHCRLNVPPVFF